MRVCVEKALFKELVKIGLHSTFGYLKAVDTCCLKRGVVIDLDAIHPLQHQDAPGRVVIIDAGDGDGGIIFEHFFKNGAPELPVEAHQVDKLIDVDEAVNHPDDKADGAQIHAYELIDVGALHFDGNLFPASREYSLVDLTERGGGSGFTLQHTEYLLDRFTQFRFDNGNDVTEWGGRHLVLQRTEHFERPLWQQVCTRTEKLPQLNHQYAELHCSPAEDHQYLDQHFYIGLDLVIAALASAYHAASFAINNPNRP